MSDDDQGLPPAADVRAVLREHGEPVNARGRLSAEEITAYQRIRDGQPGPDYDPGVTEADFPAEDEAPEPEPEQKPRRPGRDRKPRPPLSERVKAARDRAKGKDGKAKRKHPRVPVDRVVGLVWEGLGRLFTPISPPTGRCLQLQAPVAGLILEDIVKGTIVDKALQPVARAEEKGKKVLAVAGPPMIVLALEQAQGLPDAQRQMREAVLVPMLLESLMLWDDVAGEKIEAQLKRAEAEGPRRERAERIMAMIFAPPTPAGGPATSPEDEQAARAQHMAGV